MVPQRQPQQRMFSDDDSAEVCSLRDSRNFGDRVGDTGPVRPRVRHVCLARWEHCMRTDLIRFACHISPENNRLFAKSLAESLGLFYLVMWHSFRRLWYIHHRIWCMIGLKNKYYPRLVFYTRKETWISTYHRYKHTSVRQIFLYYVSESRIVVIRLPEDCTMRILNLGFSLLSVFCFSSLSSVVFSTF